MALNFESYSPRGETVGYTRHQYDEHKEFSELRPDSPAPTDVGMTSMSSYKEYPHSRPFINDNYYYDVTKPKEAYPENNRQAVMTALKSLQEKITQLEVERSHAEVNLRTLATETSNFRHLLDSSQLRAEGVTCDISTTLGGYKAKSLAADIQPKLDGAEQRCKVLEHQLKHMRNMVKNAEQDKTDACVRSDFLARQQQNIEQEDLRMQLNKITDLEREHLKLTATQTLAENKIRELEEKLREEKHYRKIMQHKAAELETAADTHRILSEAGATESLPRPKSKKSKKKKKVTISKCSSGGPHSAKAKKPNSAQINKQPGKEPEDHYNLNLGGFPFVTGKSTTPSHSLAANFQQVYSLLKSHNKLCPSPRQHSHKPPIQYFKASRPVAISRGSSKDLLDLLLQLQDEFGQMSFEHQELSQQIQTAIDSRLKEDLERELEALITKMEAKGQQIARLRQHQEKTYTSNKTTKLGNTGTVEVPVRDTDFPLNSEVEVTTTIRTTGKSGETDCAALGPLLAGRGQHALNAYKGLKKIQSSLRKDDLSWDC